MAGLVHCMAGGWYWYDPGDVRELRRNVHASENSFNRLLKLTEVPAPQPLSQQESNELSALRGIPVKDEKVVHWALEDENGDRLPLPDWLAAPIEQTVTSWAAENMKWRKKIDERESVGRQLPASSQKKYDEWLQTRKEATLVFSRKAEKVVRYIRSNADWKKLQAELFTVHVVFSDDPQQLKLKKSDGGSQRLLLWQGEPTTKEMLPAFLATAGLSAEAAAKAFREFEEDKEEDEAGSGAGDAADLADTWPHDEERQLQDEEMERQEAEMDDIEMMAGTSDEEMACICLDKGQSMHRVKDFHHRPEYRALEARTAVQVPPGCYLGYHKTTRTWQGFFSGTKSGPALTHDGSTNRSAGEALIGVVEKLIEKYLETHRDVLWNVQLAHVRKVMSTVAKL